jgi:hypothetical protein
MNSHLTYVISISFLATISGYAVVRYVDLQNPNPTTPYTSWSTASTNIQDAIDVANQGDVVLVTNGVYNTGGRTTGYGTSRVLIHKALTVQSVNGPAVTIIEGYRPPNNGSGFVRCIELTNGAFLSGFTLTKGAATESNGGGGVFAGDRLLKTTVSNCFVIGNWSSWYGGGAFGAKLQHCNIMSNSCGLAGGGAIHCEVSNCIVKGNWAQSFGGGLSASQARSCAVYANSAGVGGGGTDETDLNNCTVANNAATNRGGGVAYGTMSNCIVYFNSAPTDPNYQGSSTFLRYSCTTPMPTNGVGNFIDNPQFASFSHLSTSSPCIARGVPISAIGADIDGENWNSTPSVGCDEVHTGSTGGPVTVEIVPEYTNLTVGFEVSFSGNIEGQIANSRWEFGDGVTVSNQPIVFHAWNAPGNYLIKLVVMQELPIRETSATLAIQVMAPAIHYVSLQNSNSAPPYMSWAAAATNIQDAIDIAGPGAHVLVMDGVYNTRARTHNSRLLNRVAVTKPLVLESVNGPAATVIQGYQDVTTNGYAAVRCVSLASNAVMTGFTLTNGATLGASDVDLFDRRGGGVFCESVSSVVSNCVITGNAAWKEGGGAYSGTIRNCTFIRNSSGGGGALCSAVVFGSTIISNTAGGIGGGASEATLSGCMLLGNSVPVSGGYGGGAYGCTLSNCLLFGNSALYGYGGGAAAVGALYNCTIVANNPGTYFAKLYNSISYYNQGYNYFGYQPSTGLGAVNYCCTIPMPENGLGNITNEPGFLNFLADDFRLQSTSACINSGKNLYASTGFDLADQSRIVGGNVDIGAYEFQAPSSIISYAWLQRYGLPFDGSADYADSDGDGLNTWQEWWCQTIPTNSLSALRLLSPATSNKDVILSWQSVSGISYSLERAAGLFPAAFQKIASGVVGQDGVTSFTDTNAASDGPHFYRVLVEDR